MLQFIEEQNAILNVTITATISHKTKEWPFFIEGPGRIGKSSTTMLS
jgi:hypothetical protein